MLTTNPTMTSREIAELVESRHDKVKKSIERLADRGVIDLPPLGEYLDSMNRSAKEYRVGKRESYIVVAQLSPEFTARLVDRWQELEAAAPAAVDLNDPSALRSLLLGYSEKVITLEAKVAADAPKVEFAEIIRNTDAVCRIGDFCKTMKAGRNKLFARMKADKILMENRMPYQKYIDKGYFSVIEQNPYKDSKGVSHPAFTTMVTGAGQLFLTRKYHDLTGAV